MLGEELRKMREAAGLSQLALARKLGLKQQHVSMWEANIAKLAPHHWLKFCEAVQVEPEKLLTIISKHDEKMGYVVRFIKRTILHTGHEVARQAGPGPLPCPENLPQGVEVDPLYIIGRCLFRYPRLLKAYVKLVQAVLCFFPSTYSGCGTRLA